MNSEKIKNIYLVAICGTGMASLAGLLKEAGFNVTGSDNSIYPPMSLLLENNGITIKPGYKKENITDEIDLVVIGNAISKNNEEAQTIFEKGIPYISFPQALARFFLEGRKPLVVAGTHGKTTTSSLLSWLFYSAGKNPGFMIGGWLKGFDSNYRHPDGEYFIVEGDEYDTAFFDKGPKFLHYLPHAAILTGVEFDHADIFRDLDHIKSAFGDFLDCIDPSGFLLVEHSDANSKDLLPHVKGTVETYGFSAEADWSIQSYSREGEYGCFSLSHGGSLIGNFRVAMIGKHNALNAAATTAMALKCGLTKEQVASALETFPGIKRRQEIFGIKNGVTVIDDFAHHPTAIQFTIEAVREAYPDGNVWAVFEPRSATARRNIFNETLPKSFIGADKVIIAGLFAPEKIAPGERLDPEYIVQQIIKLNIEARFIADTNKIVDTIAQESHAGDVVLIMSSGGFDGIHQKLLNKL
ncbi:MAG: UDP-N-acetylmuramate:L-alanyl-gamma-D-glutamyl-meso-diaminopimelate ligase [Nitrospinales bacterium]